MRLPADERALSSARRIAVVIGASEWPDLGSGFDSGRAAFVHSAEGFRDYLTDPEGLALAPQDLLWLFDSPDSSVAQLTSIREHVSQCLAAEEDRHGRGVWLFCYYVGHGAFAGPSNTYCLLLRSTQRRPLTEDTSLRLPTFAEVLRDAAPRSQRVVFLDSCFSAAAVQSFQAPVEQVTATKVRESVADQGVALLCAASAYDAASFTQDRTKFTGAMLDVLTAGEPVPERQLSLRRICELTQHRLEDLYGEDASRPQCHAPNQAGGDISLVPLFPNAGFKAADRESPRRVDAVPAVDLVPVLEPATTIRSLSQQSPSWQWVPTADRGSVVPLLVEDMQTMAPDLLPIRVGRMLTSPLNFFRGSFVVMAHDLCTMPWSGVTTRLCGDATVANGTLTPTPDGRHVLDFNDYGETVVGPVEYDLCRLLVSVVLRIQDAGLSKTRKVAGAVVESYVAMVRAIAARSALEQEYFSFDERTLEHLAVPHLLAAYRASTKGLPKRASKGPLNKSRTRFRDDPPLVIRVVGQERSDVEDLVALYMAEIPAERKAFLSRFAVADVARAITGVAGVGKRQYLVLCLNRDRSDRILLRLSEALPSAYVRWLGDPGPSIVSEGRRVVLGTRAAQTLPDPLLGCVDVGETSFVFRSSSLEARYTGQLAATQEAVTNLGVSMAALLAKVHTRHLDPHELLTDIGDGQAIRRNLVTWADGYSRQVQDDHAEMRAAVRNGTLTAAWG